MVRVRKLDAEGDLVYEAGRPVLIEDDEAEAQAIRVGLSTIRGEALFHPDFGLDMEVVTAADDSIIRAGLAAAARRTGRILAVTAVERLEAMGKDKANAFAVKVLTKQDREVSAGVVLSA